jgi:outer membrane protein OmpA-like peptidoglycan-associated protein
MERGSIMEHIDGKPAPAESWTRRILLALVVSLALHAAFVWWARDYAVKTFSDSYYEQMVPRAFKVDRVEVDSRLLEDEVAAPVPATARTAPVPVDLPEEAVPAAPVAQAATPAQPAKIAIAAEAVPQVGTSALAATTSLQDAATASLEEDLDAMREALLAEQPSSAAQPAILLAAAAGQAGGGTDGATPSGYSDLDALLAQTGGLTESPAPIFMPSDVLFGYDESALGPGAITSLQKLAELIRRNPGTRFRIEGHTDSFGGPDYNARLSLARAESVKQWLAGNMGIDAARIDVRGLGSTRPLVPVTGTIEEQQLNRRVEIVILRPTSRGP